MPDKPAKPTKPAKKAAKPATKPRTEKRVRSTAGTGPAAPAAARRRTTRSPEPTHAEISVRAYFIYESEGDNGGDQLDHWLRAERDLMAGV